ncbi:carbonic anhydrase 1-like [Ruditapes philippinarum]|uniref:carbonic anhydrase 1-like n=1 Tax=Ruditapes philippinarum TaxID=129788 RepID=UPI00295B98EF|nr:carbonic anhydrase 1-like [Ruditapes philippinarum]
MDVKIIFLTIHVFITCINGQSYMYDVYEGAVIPAVTHWGYGDYNGPEEWPELFPNKCAGKYQSPVNIRPRKTKFKPNLSKFIFYDPPYWGARYFAHNNGHTIQVNTWGLHLLANGGLNHTYRIAQFHFHWGDENDQGAEHTVNEKAAPMEMHIVSWNHEKYESIKDAAKAPDGLAVLGILFKISHRDNPLFEPLIHAIPSIRDPDWNNQVEIAVVPIRNYLPHSPEKYFRYRGSLTTPRCYESVTWTVFREKQNISKRQEASVHYQGVAGTVPASPIALPWQKRR